MTTEQVFQAFKKTASKHLKEPMCLDALDQATTISDVVRYMLNKGVELDVIIGAMFSFVSDQDEFARHMVEFPNCAGE